MYTLSLILLCAVLLVDVAFSTRNGVPDNRVHQFAGYLASPIVLANNCTPANRTVYASCGGSLVYITGFPSRRMFLTARHCVFDAIPSEKFLVHFGDSDLRLPDLTCGRVVGVRTNMATTVYTGTRAWFPTLPKNYDTTLKIGGIVQNNEDYALILLDREVELRDVETEAIIFDTSSMSSARLAAFLPVVGVAGYGVYGLGTANLDYVLGQPLRESGNRDKEYVELGVRSVQDMNIIAAMVAATESDAICSGDSGSGAMRPTKLNGFYNLFGVVTSGDKNCRSTVSFTRVGTTKYNNWTASIKVDVIAAASQGRL